MSIPHLLPLEAFSKEKTPQKYTFYLEMSHFSSIFFMFSHILTAYEAKQSEIFDFLTLFIHFLQEKFASSDILYIFAPLVPAEPLYNA